MSTAYADEVQESVPTRPAPPAPRSRRLAVPVSAIVTAATLGLLQAWALAAWAAQDDKALRDVLIKWDAGWMTKIAEFGYFGFSVSPDPSERVEWQSVAFFPGYPVLVRMFSSPLSVLGKQDATFIAALVVSAAASFVFAWGVARLALDVARRMPTEGSVPPALSVRTQVVLTVAVTVLAFGAPMSFIYWMPYSEALFSALTVWALVMMLRRRYLAAGVLTLFAGLTRLTAIALILTLVVVAAVELWGWARRRSGFPVAAVTAPFVGALGMASYLHWADGVVAEIGGYFAAQERGWSSQFDLGLATLSWLSEHLVVQNPGDHDEVAYVLSSWAIIVAGVLCASSLWPLLRRWLPWQVWLTAILVAGSVLGSDGIMHARPRLLLLPVLLLSLPFVVRGVLWVARDRTRRWGGGVLLAAAGVVWCALGFGFFGWMIVEFQYGI